MRNLLHPSRFVLLGKNLELLIQDKGRFSTLSLETASLADENICWLAQDEYGECCFSDGVSPILHPVTPEEVVLASKDTYLAKAPDQTARDKFLSWKDVPPEKACFWRLLSEQEAQNLKQIISFRWALAPQGPIVQADLTKSTASSLAMGKHSFSLSQFLQKFQNSKNIPDIILNDYWRICRLRPYNPAIIIDIQPEDERSDSFISTLRSLHEISDYQGAIILLVRTGFDWERKIPTQMISFLSLLKEKGNFHVLCKKHSSFLKDLQDLISSSETLNQFFPLILIQSNLIFRSPSLPFFAASALAREIWSYNHFSLMVIPSLAKMRYVLKTALKAALHSFDFSAKPSFRTEAIVLEEALKALSSLNEEEPKRWIEKLNPGQNAHPLGVSAIHFFENHSQKSDTMKAMIEQTLALMGPN